MRTPARRGQVPNRMFGARHALGNKAAPTSPESAFGLHAL
jgi:hypothetical protein